MNNTMLFLGGLALLFGLGDLVGQRNLDRLAERWLQYSQRITTNWIHFLVRYNLFWKMLLGLMMVSILYLSAFFAFSSVSGNKWLLVGYLVWGLASVFVYQSILSLLLQIDISQFGERSFFDFEIKFIEKMKLSASRAEDDNRRGEDMVRESPHTQEFVVVGATLMFTATKFALATPLVFLFSIIARFTFIVIYFIPIFLLCFPALSLHWLAQKTGADNYINVGKYLIALLALVVTYLIDIEGA